MQIRAFETFNDAHVAFVRVTLADGTRGWGQMAPYNADITAQVFHRQVAPWAIGRDAENLETLIDLIPEREHKFPGSYLARAIGGLDTSIWDARGQQAGLSVCQLLGGTPGPLRAYASSMRRDIAPEAEAERLARLRDRDGFDAFKFRVGAECGHDIDEWPGRTEAIVPAVRAALGDSVALLVDGNSGFSPRRAIEVGRMLEAHGVCHFEEPCPYWELDQTRQVTEALALDVAGGEQDCDLITWREITGRRVVDIVQPDICYLGGMIRTLRVARMAEAAGLPVTPHSANLTMVTLFTMHLMRAIANPGSYLEYSIEGFDYYPWQKGLFTHDPYVVRDGHVTVSDAPGWGVEVAPEWLARSTYRLTETP